MSYADNMAIETINDQIDAGMLTTDTVEMLKPLLYLWSWSPIAFLIGLILFVFERSKGTDLPASAFFEYEALLIIAITSSVYITWTYGLSADQMFGYLEANPLTANVLSEFDTSEMRMTLLRLMYISLCVPGYLGTFLFMIFPITKQTDTTWFFGDEEEDQGSEEAVTQFSPQQFL